MLRVMRFSLQCILNLVLIDFSLCMSVLDFSRSYTWYVWCCLLILFLFFFFFQAEDGIRDLYVTGVQTCALPICFRGAWTGRRLSPLARRRHGDDRRHHRRCE